MPKEVIVMKVIKIIVIFFLEWGSLVALQNRKLPGRYIIWEGVLDLGVYCIWEGCLLKFP